MIQREPKKDNSANQNGLRFLTVKDATRIPQAGKVVAARIQPDNFKSGSQVVAVRVEFKGQHWMLNLRPNNPNVDRLCDAWGEDELQWTGKMMLISVREDKDFDLNNKLWLHLEAKAPEPTPTPAATEEVASNSATERRGMRR